MNSGAYSSLQVHLGECPNRQVDCTLGCGQSLPKHNLSLHISSQCSKRPTECQHCNTSVPLHDLEVSFDTLIHAAKHEHDHSLCRELKLKL